MSELADDLKKQYDLDRDGSIELLDKTRKLFFKTFGDTHPFCQDILKYYDEEIWKMKFEKETEMARLDHLWEIVGGDK